MARRTGAQAHSPADEANEEVEGVAIDSDDCDGSVRKRGGATLRGAGYGARSHGKGERDVRNMCILCEFSFRSAAAPERF